MILAEMFHIWDHEADLHSVSVMSSVGYSVSHAGGLLLLVSVVPAEHKIAGTRLPEGAAADLKVIGSLISGNPRIKLVSVNLDLPRRQRSKYYYLQEIEKFLRNCKHPGGEWLYLGMT